MRSTHPTTGVLVYPSRGDVGHVVAPLFHALLCWIIILTALTSVNSVNYICLTSSTYSCTALKPPCMIVVQYILPSLRVAVARELVEELGLKKTDAAQKMNVTPAAVTQYLNRSRGEKATTVIEGSEKIRDLISDLSRDLLNEESPSDLQLMKLCRACHEIRAEGLICELHKEAMPSLRTLDVCSCSLGLE